MGGWETSETRTDTTGGTERSSTHPSEDGVSETLTTRETSLKRSGPILFRGVGGVEKIQKVIFRKGLVEYITTKGWGSCLLKK